MEKVVIKDSVNNTANNNNTPLNQEEANSIVNTIISEIHNKHLEEIGFAEIRKIILGELKIRGLDPIAEAYASGSMMPKKTKL